MAKCVIRILVLCCTFRQMKTITHHCCLIFLLILLFSGNTYAQLSHSDTLKLQIAKETNDTEKIRQIIYFVLRYAENGSEEKKYLQQANDLSRKIQTNMTYPGQIKITVIRETRAISYAK